MIQFGLDKNTTARTGSTIKEPVMEFSIASNDLKSKLLHGIPFFERLYKEKKNMERNEIKKAGIRKIADSTNFLVNSRNARKTNAVMQ